MTNVETLPSQAGNPKRIASSSTGRFGLAIPLRRIAAVTQTTHATPYGMAHAITVRLGVIPKSSLVATRPSTQPQGWMRLAWAAVRACPAATRNATSVS